MELRLRLTGLFAFTAFLSALLASLFGSVLIALTSAVEDALRSQNPLGPSDLPIEFVLIMGVAAFPATFVGLLIFGIPLALLSRRWSDRRGFVLVAALIGGLLGYLAWAAVLGGISEVWNPRANAGAWFGASAGLSWFVLARWIIGPQLKDKEDAPPEPSPS